MSDKPELTEAEISEIEARANAAAQGPWIANDSRIDQLAEHPDGHRLLSGDNAHGDDDYSNFTVDDCAFIAHARTDVPRLCRSLRVARAENERLLDHAHCEQCDKSFYGENGEHLDVPFCGQCWNRAWDKVKVARAMAFEEAELIVKSLAS